LNLLFVCSENKLRSSTGEKVFSKYNEINTIGCGTNKAAQTVISGDLIEWSDIIFVMENNHREKVSKKFRDLLKNKKMVCLGIADNYEYMNPLLVRLIEERVINHIKIPLTLKNE